MKWLILTWSLIWWRHHISRINLFSIWCCWCRSRARWTLGLLSISKRTLTLLLKIQVFKSSAEMDLFTCWAFGSFPYPRGHSLCPPPCVDLSKSSNVLFAGSAILKNFIFYQASKVDIRIRNFLCNARFFRSRSARSWWTTAPTTSTTRWRWCPTSCSFLCFLKIWWQVKWFDIKLFSLQLKSEWACFWLKRS